MNKKNELRKVMLKLRLAQSEKDRVRKNGDIKKALFSRQEFIRADSIMFYLAKDEEVRTEGAIRESLSLGKRVLVPIVEKTERKLIPSVLMNYDKELRKGAYGILEPKSEYARPFPAQEIELIIVPGAAFDKKGGRIGFGAGFYDNFLSELSACRIGLAYGFQVLDKLPLNEGDEPLDIIITEEEIYRRPFTQNMPHK